MTEWDGNERRRPHARLSAVGPYLAICVVVIVGFFVLGRYSARIEAEGIARDRAICEDGNERAAAVRLFVRLLVEPDGAVPTTHGQEIIDLADDVFAAKECETPRQASG